jgi:hypothetical protein
MKIPEDYNIYVDAGQPATLNDGAGKLTDFLTPTVGGAGLARIARGTEDTGNSESHWWPGLHC